MSIVGVIEYLSKVDPSGAERGMAELAGKTKAEMAALDGIEAVLKLSAESRDLDRKMDKAKIDLQEIDGQRAVAKLLGDSTNFDAHAAAVRAEIKDMEKEKATITIAAKGAAKTVAEMKAVEAAQGRLNNAREQSATNLLKESAEISKLRTKYNGLLQDMKKLENVKPAFRRSEGENLRLAQLGDEALLTAHRIKTLGGSVDDIKKDVEDGRGPVDRFRNALANVGKTRINLGPFSTTMRGLLPIMGLLGPILTSLVGSAGALIGVLGTGLTGAAVVASGAISGFGLVALGLLPSIKALFGELKTTPSITGPLQKMKDSLTGGIRKPFFADAHAGIKTLQADFPVFQKGAEGAFKAASTGFQGWMKGLRGPEAQNLLGTILSNFTKGLPSVMAGLGTIGASLGRVAASGSKFLPSLNKGFAEWAQHLSTSIGSGDALDQKVGRLVGHMRDLGHFAQASGGLLTTFFNSGANSGDNLLKTFTATENRWTAWMKTVGGQQSLQNFFKGAVDNSKAFFSALAPLLSTFVQLSNAFTPITTGALKFATAIGSAVHAITSFGIGTVGLKTLGATIAAAFVVNKITGFAGGLRAAAAALGLVAPAEAEAAAATTANTAALEANTVAMAENAAAMGVAEGELAGLAVAEEAAGAAALEGGAAMAGGEVAAGGLAAALGPVGLVLAAIIGGGVALNAVFGGHTPTAFDDAAKSIDGFNKSDDQAILSMRDLQKQQKTSNDSWTQANKLAKEGKDHTNSYAQAVRRGAQADLNAAKDRQQHNQAVATARTNLDNLKKQTTAATAELQKNAQSIDPMTGRASDAFKQEAQGVATLRQQVALAEVNFVRLQAGLGRVGPAFTQALSKIKGIAGPKVAAKLEVTGSAAVVQDIAKVSSGLKRLGQGQKAIKILADTGSAESKLQALKSLLNQTQQTRKAKVTAEVSSAVHNVGLVNSTIDRLKSKNVTISQSGAQSAAAAVASLNAEINALHSKAVTETTNIVIHRGLSPYTGGVVSHAAGGIEDMLNRAHDTAGRHGALNPQGGTRLNTPRYIAGEEPGRTEYIITDNPAYKRSNLGYLAEAAAALGALIIPGYKSGGAHTSKKRKKKNGASAQTFPGSLDDQQNPGTDYDQAERNASYLADLAGLAQRNYDLGKSPLSSVTSALLKEYGAYSTLSGVINNMISGKAVTPVSAGPKPPKPPKKAKKAVQNKYKQDLAAWQASVQNAQDFNSAIKDRFDLQDERRTIEDVTKPNLLLDILEAKNAASTNTILGQESTNKARQDLYSQFASNLTGGPGGIPSSGTGPPQSFAAQPSFASRAANPGPTAGQPSGGSGGSTVNIVNNFQTQPQDPHTWANNTVFEISAAGA